MKTRENKLEEVVLLVELKKKEFGQHCALLAKNDAAKEFVSPSHANNLVHITKIFKRHQDGDCFKIVITPVKKSG